MFLECFVFSQMYVSALVCKKAPHDSTLKHTEQKRGTRQMRCYILTSHKWAIACSAMKMCVWSILLVFRSTHLGISNFCRKENEYLGHTLLLYLIAVWLACAVTFTYLGNFLWKENDTLDKQSAVLFRFKLLSICG